MDERLERMFEISTIDDPVLARQLYLDMESSLPINVRITERGFEGLKEQSVSISNAELVYQIESLFYTSDMGGILCSLNREVSEDAEDDEKRNAIMISLTHLRVDPSHPLAARIKEYQKIRNTRLAISNSGMRLKPFKSNKKKRGFGG